MNLQELERGALLIASPEIRQGFFSRSVILLCEHEGTGSFGLVINKPIDASVPTELVPVDTVKNGQLSLRAGGPLGMGQLMLLHNQTPPHLETLEICRGVHLGGDLDFLRELAGDEGKGPALLVFGYTAWPPGELERECLEGMWILKSGESKDLFTTPPQGLWSALLKELGGKYASFAEIPENLDLN